MNEGGEGINPSIISKVGKVTTAASEPVVAQPEKTEDKENKPWKEYYPRNEIQQRADNALNQTIALVRKNLDTIYPPDSTDSKIKEKREKVVQALQEADYIDKNVVGTTHYEPDNGNYIKADGKTPDNWSGHFKVIMDTYEQGNKNKVFADSDQETVKVIETDLVPRLKKIKYQDKEGEGLEFTDRSSRDRVEIMQRSAPPLLKKLLEVVQVRNLDKANPDLLGKIVAALGMVSEKKADLPSFVQLQLVHELLGELPPELSQLEFTEKWLDQQGVSRERRNTVASVQTDIAIAYARESEGGIKNLFTEWLGKEMQGFGINLEQDDAKKLEEIKGLDIVKVIEAARFQQSKVEGSLSGKILEKLGVHISNLIKTNIPALEQLIANKEALDRINQKIFGASNFSEELVGHELAKKLNRLDPKKLPLMNLGIGAMMLYSMVGPLGSDEEEGQHS